MIDNEWAESRSGSASKSINPMCPALIWAKLEQLRWVQSSSCFSRFQPSEICHLSFVVGAAKQFFDRFSFAQTQEIVPGFADTTPYR